MAHYAEIDETNTVLRVIVVSNDVEAPANNDVVMAEELGKEWLAAFPPTAGGTWVKTSYNGNIRKNFAGIGFAYDAGRDAFIPPKPYPSWILDDQTCLWVAPVPQPNDGQPHVWNETLGAWE